MKLDQVAFICENDDTNALLKSALGLADKEWIEDRVTARSIIYDPNGKALWEGDNVGVLQFNYDLGIELEILRYVEGRNWHQMLNPADALFAIFNSHQGFHLDDGEDFPEMKGFPVVQKTWTKSHTANYLTRPSSPGYGRKYEYRIHEISPGSYVKFIKRINPA